jgi:small subunit ribosomal protein S15
MALTTEQKAAIVKEFGKTAKDTGSSSVQIAILTTEINQLNAHLAVHIHDFHSRRGLLMKVGQRRSLLDYLKETNLEEYQALLTKLNLRR